MAEPMTEDEWRAFIVEAPRTGKLGVVRPDGRPMVVPIWFVLDDDDVIRFQTNGSSAKTAAMRHEPRVCLTVDDEAPPYRFAMIEAVATVLDDVELMWRVARDCGARFMGVDRGIELADRNAVAGECVVELRPVRVVAERDISE